MPSVLTSSRLLIALAVAAAAVAVTTAAASEPSGPSPGHSTAAASATSPGAKMAGCRIFPRPPRRLDPRAPSIRSLAAWNQDVSRAPVARRSDAIVRRINSAGDDNLHPSFGTPREYGIPFRVVGRGQRRVPIRYSDYGFHSDKGPFPIPLGSPVEGGRGSDGDRHVIVLQRSTCRLFELYRAFPRQGRRHHWVAGSGAAWNLRSGRTRPDGWTSADAAGLPILPGLVRFSEVRRGRIDHAIRVTFRETRDAWIRPATHCAGSTLHPDAPAMGTRLRLKRGYSLGSLSGQSLVVARALKRYGMIVADNGSNWFLSGAPSRHWNDQNLDRLKEIPGTAFEVVRSAARPHLCR